MTATERPAAPTIEAKSPGAGAAKALHPETPSYPSGSKNQIPLGDSGPLFALSFIPDLLLCRLARAPTKVSILRVF